MSATFKVDTLIHTEHFYDKINTFTDGIPYYETLSKTANGPVLELCCGTGRITIPLKKAGIDITGLDFSTSMLESAKKKHNEQSYLLSSFKQT